MYNSNLCPLYIITYENRLLHSVFLRMPKPQSTFCASIVMLIITEITIITKPCTITQKKTSHMLNMSYLYLLKFILTPTSRSTEYLHHVVLR